MDRTDKDIMARRGVRVMFGDAQHELRPAPLARSDEWLELFEASVTRCASAAMAASGSAQGVDGAPADVDLASLIEATYTGQARDVVRLVAAYDDELSEDVLTETATREQIALAFEVITSFELDPIRGVLTMALKGAGE